MPQSATTGAIGLEHTLAMTEQEAQVWAERLVRVWDCDNFTSGQWERIMGRRGINIALAHKLTLHIWTQDSSRHGSGVFVRLSQKLTRPYVLWLTLHPNGEIKIAIPVPCHLPQSTAPLPTPILRQRIEFVAEHVDFFRRGCWLSGCAVEASAHEKAEWIQGFSREELESWNLK